MLAAMFSGKYLYLDIILVLIIAFFYLCINPTFKSDRVFIDRPSKPFATILDFLRTGDICFPTDPDEQSVLLRELDYYGLTG